MSVALLSPPGVSVLGAVPSSAASSVLSSDALRFLSQLHRRFDAQSEQQSSHPQPPPGRSSA